MAALKKRYRNGQPRTGVPQKTALTRRTPKDYSKQVRSHHGSNTEEVQEKLAQQIKRKKTYG